MRNPISILFLPRLWILLYCWIRRTKVEVLSCQSHLTKRMTDKKGRNEEGNQRPEIDASYQISLNFSTTSPDFLLLTQRHTHIFIGIHWHCSYDSAFLASTSSTQMHNCFISLCRQTGWQGNLIPCTKGEGILDTLITRTEVSKASTENKEWETFGKKTFGKRIFDTHVYIVLCTYSGHLSMQLKNHNVITTRGE